MGTPLNLLLVCLHDVEQLSRSMPLHRFCQLLYLGMPCVCDDGSYCEDCGYVCPSPFQCGSIVSQWFRIFLQRTGSNVCNSKATTEVPLLMQWWADMNAVSLQVFCNSAGPQGASPGSTSTSYSRNLCLRAEDIELLSGHWDQSLYLNLGYVVALTFSACSK